MKNFKFIVKKFYSGNGKCSFTKSLFAAALIFQCGMLQAGEEYSENQTYDESVYAQQDSSLSNHVEEGYTNDEEDRYSNCDPCCDNRFGYNDPPAWNNGASEYFNGIYLKTFESCEGGGIWLPEDPSLFRPFVADPRQITYSVGWRFHDHAFSKNVADVSFGDTFAIYRWCNIGPYCGQLQLELEGAVWAIFAPMSDTSPLINADYYVGLPLTYAFDRWAFRLRLFHISSHIGDEWMIKYPNFDRRNASAEYLDFFISLDLTEEIRFYSGLGYIISQDKEFRCKRFYAALGTELRLPSLGFLDNKDQLYGLPFYGMHMRANGDFKRHVDMTYVLGYEIGKLCGLCRKVRLFAEYHDGYCPDGQFFRIADHYFALRASYGF